MSAHPTPSEQMDTKTSRDTLYVLGMHRSGTSALTRTLGLMGYNMPDALVPPNDFNERGFWEPEALVHANDRILRIHQRHWADPKPLDISIGRAEAAKAVAIQCRTEHFPEISGMVLKDPRLSRTFPYWRTLDHADGNARVLIALRNPLEVARSLSKSANIRFDHAIRLWQTYMLEAEFHSRGIDRQIVFYDTLLTDWRAALGSFGQEGSADADPIGVNAFLSTSLRHQKVGDDEFYVHPDIPDGVKSLYASLRDKGNMDAKTSYIDDLRKRWRAEWSGEAAPEGVSHYVHRLPYWNIERASHLFEQGKAEAALPFAQAAGQQDRDNPDFAKLHSRILMELGRNGEAIPYLKGLSKTLPDDPNVKTMLAEALYRTGDFANAELQACSLAEPTADQWAFIGNLRLAQKKDPAAHGAFNRALGLDPENASAKAGIARLMARDMPAKNAD